MNLSKVQDVNLGGHDYQFDKVDDDNYKVVVDRVPKYLISKTGQKWKCNCPGFTYRGVCKHMQMFEKEILQGGQKKGHSVNAGLKHQQSRRPRAELEAFLPQINEALKGFKHEVVGSFRRKKDTFKDADILVLCGASDMKTIEARLEEDPEYELVTSGPDILRGWFHGIEMDISRVPSQSEWGGYLMYRTGSADFNVDLRRILKMKDWALNEHGLYNEANERIAGDTEESIFEALGIPYIKPEYREKGKYEKFLNMIDKTKKRSAKRGRINGIMFRNTEGVDPNPIDIGYPIVPKKFNEVLATVGRNRKGCLVKTGDLILGIECYSKTQAYVLSDTDKWGIVTNAKKLTEWINENNLR